MSEKISRRELIQKSLLGFGLYLYLLLLQVVMMAQMMKAQKYKQIFFMVSQAGIHYKIKLFCGHE
ncbi:hypothetical protein SG90_003890 [Acinetobacter baumannii]|nr:hypothetical protein SG90_003890 [Acinetobacter baumannii]